MDWRRASLRQAYQMVQTDSFGLTLWVNAAFTAGTGYTLDDMRGRPPGAVLQCAASRPEPIAEMAAAIRERRPCWGIELVNRRKDGSDFLVRLDIEPQFDASGTLTGFLSVQVDLTGELAQRHQLTMLQRWYQATLGDPTIGFWERNLDTDEAVWDEGMRGLWEWPAGASPPSSADLRESILPEHRPATDAAWAGAAEDGASGQAAYRIRTRGGRVRWVQSNWTVLSEPDGSRFACGSVRDITDAVEARAEKDLEREQLMLGTEVGRVGLMREDLRTHCMQANAAARLMFDLPEGVPLERRFVTSRIHADDLPRVEASWKQLLDGTDPMGELSYRVCRSDGTVAHVLARRRVMHDSRGEPVESIGAFIDVTEAARAASRERAIAARLSMALDIAQVGVWELGELGGQIHFDERMLALYGWAGRGPQVAVDAWMASVHPDDRGRIAETWREVERGDRLTGVSDFRIVRGDGELRTMRANYTRIVDAGGALRGVRGTSRDITEELRAEEARSRSQAALAQRDEAAALAQSQSTVLAAVSHEIRSPLNALMVACEQLSEPPRVSAAAGDRQPWLQVMREAVTHLQGLAEDLLRGVAVDAAAEAVPHAPVELLEAADRAARWLRPVAEEAGVTVVVDDTSLRRARVHGSAQRVRQITLNLLSNAIKYNRRGGRVRVHAASRGDGMSALVVEDDGQGMSEAQRQRLFRPFDRLGREDGDTGGFGFGLYLVQRLVQAMGGEIEVSTRLGRGSRFTVWLPDAPRAASARRSGPHRALPDGTLLPSGWADLPDQITPRIGRGGRLLLVDDDELSPLLLSAQLGRLGPFELSTAATSGQVLSRLAEGQPRLALVDLNVGTTRGETVLAMLRQAGYDGPAVAYTGDADPLRQDSARAAGFDEVWIKPLRQEELAAGLARVLAD